MNRLVRPRASRQRRTLQGLAVLLPVLVCFGAGVSRAFDCQVKTTIDNDPTVLTRGDCPKFSPVVSNTWTGGGNSSSGSMMARAETGRAFTQAQISGNHGNGTLRTSALSVGVALCHFTGPDTSVLTRVRYEISGTAAVTTGGDFSQVILGATLLGTLFTENNSVNLQASSDIGVRCPSRGGLFLAMPCSASMSIPQVIVEGAEFSAPIGVDFSVSLSVQSTVMHGGGSSFRSESSAIRLSFPSDLSQVFVLPAGFDMSCDDAGQPGSLHGNVWNDPAPPIPLLSAGALFTLAGLLMLAAFAVVWQRSAARG